MAAPGGRLVRVAVDAQVDHPGRTFTYRLPDDLPADMDPAPGALLLVPYGKRRALGYLLAGEADPVEQPAEVEAVVSRPMLTDDLLVLAEAIADRYRAPIGTAIAAMLPPGLESRLERRWFVTDPSALGLDIGSAGDLSDAALRRMAGRGGERWIERQRRSGGVRAAWRLRPPSAGPRRVRIVRRTSGAPTRVRGAVQQAILAAVDGSFVLVPELEERLERPAGSLADSLGRLAAAGLVELGWADAPRDPLAHRTPGRPTADHLADEQQAAVAAIRDARPGGEVLLEGIAASGKSDVILAAVAASVAAGEGAVVLVPEVSLVPQLADRLRGTVGPRLATLHSGLSAGERHDEWMRILGGGAQVVIGTRTAVFAPLHRLGLIVLDEAHDASYKADRAPRYDARWVARRRATLTGARLVQATATPDVVSVHRARGGELQRVRLRERRAGAAPTVSIVDMRAELAEGNRSVLSRALAEAIAELGVRGGAVDPGVGREQAILLINRRGAATFVLCRDCGEPIRCPECTLPMVQHLAESELRCHHDGHSAPLPTRCPRCGSGRIRYFGAGTQRVEAEIRARFPGLRVGRLDSDALAARRRFESIYDDFADGRLDVLVGTQLVAKGLDLPSVTLVAVLAADLTLHLPDFLAPERTFQLVAQVAGRAGRGPMAGRVVIQTYAPDHPAIRAAAALDVDAFVDGELPNRRMFGYPPFGWLARLLVADPDPDRGRHRAEAAATAVGAADVEVYGPLPAWVPRRAGRWRWQVVIRAGSEDARAAAVARVPPGVGIDVDPASLL